MHSYIKNMKGYIQEVANTDMDAQCAQLKVLSREGTSSHLYIHVYIHICAYAHKHTFPPI